MPAQIFVVDTNPGQAEFAMTLLEHAGFTTRAFDDHTVAGHAFAFASTAPQLMIVRDSETDPAGTELLRFCKAFNPQMRVIAVCDSPRKHEPKPADAVIHEPYCGRQLVESVRQLCTPQLRHEAPILLREADHA